jgi:hypothetical protein
MRVLTDAIFVSSATDSVTNNFDIGLAVPVCQLSGEAHAVLEGPTFDCLHILVLNIPARLLGRNARFGDVAPRLQMVWRAF